MATVTLQGTPLNTNGEPPAVGSKAPDFKLTNKALEDVSFANYPNRKKLLNIVPSLDTPTCATSTRKFNEAMAKRDDAVCLVISADLPFAQERFCSTEGIEGVEVLSMMKNKDFARDYGVLITDGPLEGLTARCVIVTDEDNNVIYRELVGEIADEPNYDAALKALDNA